MLAKRIIPCLDVKGGKVVKGVRFEGLKEVGEPSALAKRYEEEGADEIVFLDIAATNERRRTIFDAVRRTAEKLFVPLTVGGGVRRFEDVRELLRAGADKVSINTAAVRTPSLIRRLARAFGSQCVVVAVDSKRVDGRDAVFTNAGTKETRLETVSWARRAAELGAGEILLTSIDHDGTTRGYAVELTRRVAEAAPVPVIASGGGGSAAHMAEVLTEGGAAAALAASIFHFGTTTVAAVKDELRKRGLFIR